LLVSSEVPILPPRGHCLLGLRDKVAGKAKSNSHLSRAQSVPNLPRNCGHSRLIMVSLFLCTEGNRLAKASPISSSKLVTRVQFLFLLYDRPLSLRDLGLLTVASPRPVERTGRAACPNAPATAPRSPH